MMCDSVELLVMKTDMSVYSSTSQVYLHLFYVYVWYLNPDPKVRGDSTEQSTWLGVNNSIRKTLFGLFQ